MNLSIRVFEPIVKTQPWGTETIVAQTSRYLGKVLRYRAGKAGGLQYHRRKDETFFLFEGTGWLDYDSGDGTFTRKRMEPGMSVDIPAGAVHRFEAETDCLGFEASTPVYDDRVRCEEAYGVPVIGDQYGLETTGAMAT